MAQRMFDALDKADVEAGLALIGSDAQWRGFDLVPRTPSDDEAHERLFTNA